MNERIEYANNVFASREKKNGEFHTLFQGLLNGPKFSEYFRMSRDTFYYILQGIEESIMKHSNFRGCISPEERLAVTLR